ncbi:hypothetical protein N9928_01365, partial [bacterium]|nr:hypothetical protein [bacterium]
SGYNYIDISSTGFTMKYPASNHIYIAIRRGTKVPESGTEVFAIDTGTGTIPTYVSGFPVDMSINRQPSVSTDNRTGTRLTGNNRLVTNSTAAQASDNAFVYDYMEGWSESYANSTHYSWMWKRAPGYFDAVAYTGDGVAGRTVSHNLGVAPEMMWVKRRNANSNWSVYHSAIGNDKYIVLNTTNTPVTSSTFWNNTDPTASSYTVGTSNGTNNTNNTYIAYLFASLPGISKVGSYTGTGQAGGNINVDCGFSSGARFVLIKRTDASGSWWFADTSRGIVSGNEPLLALDSSGAEVTGFNMVEPYSSGFTVNGSGVGSDNSWNDAGGNYIFYAIA